MKLYIDKDLPQNERWAKRYPKPDNPEKVWCVKGNTTFAVGVTDADLAEHNIIPATDERPEIDESTQIAIPTNGADDQGKRIYEVRGKTSEELAAEKATKIDELWHAAKEHSDSFADVGGWLSLTTWLMELPMTQPAFWQNVEPWAGLLRPWKESIWDRYYIEKAKILSGESHSTDFLSMVGKPNFTFAEVNFAVRNLDTSQLPSPQLVYEE